MNVYDFDKTIFYPDCSFAFIRWCLRRYPRLWITYVPSTLLYAIQYKLKLAKKNMVEEKMFSFVKSIENIEQEVLDFWAVYEKRISPWYLKQKKEDDLIISASPEFLLKPIVERLGVRLIATQLDMKTAKIVGYSCFGRQKVRRAMESKYFPQNCIDRFYSDSLSDAPMALCAEEAFLVTDKARKPVPWPQWTQKTKIKIKKKLAEDMTRQ